MSNTLPALANQPTQLAFPQVKELGEVLYKSGYFKDIQSAAQAVVKVLRGQELGLGPVTALEAIHVVQGRTALSAALIGALIKRSGRYDYRVIENTDARCAIVFLQDGKEIGTSVFTIEDAKRAGLLGRESWQRYPRNMNFARAMSNGARWFCPDVFNGPIYTPEELDTPSMDSETTVVDADASTTLVPEPDTTDATPDETTKEMPQPPAREPGEDDEERELAQEQKPQPAPQANGKKATEKQVKAIYAIMRSIGATEEWLKARIKQEWGVESVKDLTFEQASKVIDGLKILEQRRKKPA